MKKVATSRLTGAQSAPKIVVRRTQLLHFLQVHIHNTAIVSLHNGRDIGVVPFFPQYLCVSIWSSPV